MAQHCQKFASNGKKFKIKIVWNWISSKKVKERICLSHTPSEWSSGARNIGMVEKLYCTEKGKYIQLRAQHCQKYVLHGNKLEMKVVRNRNLSTKVRERICLSPLGVELGDSKYWYGWKIILYRNSKIHSFKGSTLPKVRITWKKAWNESCSELNFVQKVRECICLFPPGVELVGSKDQYVWNLRRRAHQWNKLLEPCCKKYEMFVWWSESIYFNATAHTMKQETYVSCSMFHETY